MKSFWKVLLTVMMASASVKIIASYPIPVWAEDVTIMNINEVFER